MFFLPIQRKLNSEDTAWDSLAQETNLGALSGLLWSWLSQLDVSFIIISSCKLRSDALAKFATYIFNFILFVNVYSRETLSNENIRVHIVFRRVQLFLLTRLKS